MYLALYANDRAHNENLPFVFVLGARCRFALVLVKRNILPSSMNPCVCFCVFQRTLTAIQVYQVRYDPTAYGRDQVSEYLLCLSSIGLRSVTVSDI